MHRLTRILAWAVIAALPALGLTAGLSGAANASSAGASRSAPAGADAVALAIIRHLQVGQHGTDQRLPGVHRVSGLSQVESSNWSGYADTGSGFSKATGKWTEPGATCSRSTTYAAFWVGIDGYSSDSVEQDGTFIECYESHAYQYSWWEMYPTNDIQVVGESVAAGDSISASVVRSGDSYTHRLHPHREQLHHHADLLGLREQQRRVDRRGTVLHQQWRHPAPGRLWHLVREQRDGDRGQLLRCHLLVHR